jgi:hypothetical protein
LSHRMMRLSARTAASSRAATPPPLRLHLPSDLDDIVDKTRSEHAGGGGSSSSSSGDGGGGSSATGTTAGGPRRLSSLVRHPTESPRAGAAWRAQAMALLSAHAPAAAAAGASGAAGTVARRGAVAAAGQPPMEMVLELARARSAPCLSPEADVAAAAATVGEGQGGALRQVDER